MISHHTSVGDSDYKRRLTPQEQASEKIIRLARENGLDVTLRPAGSTD